MTMRLSASSFAGTARTLVAVGTVSETFMFLTTLAAAPRRGDCVPAATGGAGGLAGLFPRLGAGGGRRGGGLGGLVRGLGGGGLRRGGTGRGGTRGRGGGGRRPRRGLAGRRGGVRGGRGHRFRRGGRSTVR